MKLSKVIEAVRTLAPEALAEPWDRVGLQIGDPDQEVRRGLLCIDLTESVVAEARQLHCQLIVAYHPPIFEPLSDLARTTWKHRVVRELIQRNIAVYSPHTALDAALDGINDWLLRGLGVTRDIRAITPSCLPQPEVVKIITFVPPPALDAVRDALAAAGAGRIGRYGKCSFTTAGQGTFEGDADTHPAIGQAGRFERVEEIRLEMVCHRALLDGALTALRRTHPYEEPAVDVLPLVATGQAAPTVGAGRMGSFERAISVETLIQRVKSRLGLRLVEVAIPRGTKRVRRVGVCAGAGASLLQQAPDLDVWITGEMRHHDVLDALQRRQMVVLAGHTQTERPYLVEYRRRLASLGLTNVSWAISRRDLPPSVIR